MPLGGDRAMASFDPGSEIEPAAVARLAPRSVVCDLDQLGLVPADARTYVSSSDATAARWAGRLPPELGERHTLIANAVEACTLSGAPDPTAAAHTLAQRFPRVVVTLGAGGAIAIVDGEETRAGAPSAHPVDATGAGDVFTATWAWADLNDLAPHEALAWATLHAAVSVTAPTGVAGAQTLEQLMQLGSDRGLAPPDLPGADRR